jgi:hypothetical protein
MTKWRRELDVQTRFLAALRRAAAHRTTKKETARLRACRPKDILTFDDLIRRNLLFCKKVRVDRSVTLPFFREIFEGKNRSHRANRHARSAIDTFRGIDEQLLYPFVVGLILARVNAVDRANVNARGVFGADTGLGNYVCHSRSPLLHPIIANEM